jgi:histidine triad (HIT) family protein
VIVEALREQKMLAGLPVGQEGCPFCDLIENEPDKFVYSDDFAVAFPSKSPVAPTHLLVVPRRHVDSLSGAILGEELGHLLNVVKILSVHTGVAATGYRTIINTGKDAHQTVKHLHVHLLGGRDLAFEGF